jgi:hypothetical protein
VEKCRRSTVWSGLFVGGECDRGQIDLRPLFDVPGGWTLVLVGFFLCNLNYEILSWKL